MRGQRSRHLQHATDAGNLVDSVRNVARQFWFGRMARAAPVNDQDHSERPLTCEISLLVCMCCMAYVKGCGLGRLIERPRVGNAGL